MAGSPDRAGIARFVDDWIEEVVVGTPWWILALAFGVGIPVVLGAGALIFGLHYQPGTYGIAVFTGILVALALRLIARERERYRARILDSVGDLKALSGLTWADFEIAVGQLVRRQGFTVKERGGFHGDGGIDLIAEGRQGRIVIQCKQWKAWSVNVARVRELYGTVKGDGFVEGWLVTCGVFTRAARSWARGKELRLIDGRELGSFVHGAPTLSETPKAEPVSTRSSPTSHLECPNCGGGLSRLNNAADGSQFWGCMDRTCGWTFNDPPTTPGVVHCDRGHPMVQRRTKRGVVFWGCSAYPNCQRKRLDKLAYETVLER